MSLFAMRCDSTLTPILAGALLTISCVALCCRQSSSPAGLPADWSSTIRVSIEAAEVEGERYLVLAGVDGWFVNALYPGISVSIIAGSAEPFDLDRGQVRYEGRAGEDKALRALFPLAIEQGEPAGFFEGSYRAVVCTDDACSPPFSGTFSVPSRGD